MDANYFLRSLTTGDNRGITMIYENLYPKVSRYICTHDGTDDDAKDIMQKALMQLAVRAQDPGFEITTSFDGYFMTICINLWRRQAKNIKQGVTLKHEFDHANEDEEIALGVYEQRKWELFDEKLKQLSDNCRELLKLFFNKVSYKKISSLKGYANENTVKQRIFKCKAKLKESVQSDPRYKGLKDFGNS